MPTDAEEQAECVVRALEAYVDVYRRSDNETTSVARSKLVRTIAAALRMSEPKKSDLQKQST